ncbi:hypothetical protein LguiB_010112 [Lonicera macranthoides]
MYGIMYSGRSHEIEMIRYVRGVNRLLKLHQGNKIDQLRVCFSLNARNHRDVDEWVRLALQKKVKSLELDFSNSFGHSQSNPYIFPSLQELLNSTACSSSISTTPFTHLKSLSLIHLSVTKEVLHYVLANCCSLEQLCVEGSKQLSDFKVVGPSLKLKYLELHRCEPLQNLEISAPNLVTFVYSGPKEMHPFKDAPLLSDLRLRDQYCYDFIFESHRHLSFMSRLEKLHLTIPPDVSDDLVVMNSAYFPHEFPKLHNLKQLELAIGLARGYPLICYTSLIKASPSLLRFALKLSPMMVRRGNRQRERTKHSHECLKFIELSGFCGHQPDFDLALHLLEIACVSLESITIDTCKQTLFKNERFAKSRKKESKAKERARKLEAKLPPGAFFSLPKIRFYDIDDALAIVHCCRTPPLDQPFFNLSEGGVELHPASKSINKYAAAAVI